MLHTVVVRAPSGEGGEVCYLRLPCFNIISKNVFITAEMPFSNSSLLLYRGRSFDLYVTFLSPAKTAEPIEMPFAGLSRVKPCIRWGANPPREGAIFAGCPPH